MNFRLLLLCFFLANVAAFAQEVQLGFGATVGVPITLGVVPENPSQRGITTVTTTTAFGPRGLAGPALTLFVDDRLSVDVEAIFRPVRFETRSEETCCTFIDTVRATALEVPIFVSYRFGRSNLRPYVGAGLIPYEKQWGRIDAHNTFHDRGDLQTNVVFTYPGIVHSASRMHPADHRCSQTATSNPLP